MVSDLPNLFFLLDCLMCLQVPGKGVYLNFAMTHSLKCVSRRNWSMAETEKNGAGEENKVCACCVTRCMTILVLETGIFLPRQM